MSRVSYKMYTLNNGVLIRDSNVVLIQQTVAGIKIRALSNSLLLNQIDPEQIVEVLEY